MLDRNLRSAYSAVMKCCAILCPGASFVKPALRFVVAMSLICSAYMFAQTSPSPTEQESEFSAPDTKVSVYSVGPDVITGIERSPKDLGRIGVEGSVVLRLTFEKDGSVKDLGAVSGPVELREQAVALAKHAHREVYQPYADYTKPTEVWIVFKQRRQNDTSISMPVASLDSGHSADRGPLIVAPTLIVPPKPVSKQPEVILVDPPNSAAQNPSPSLQTPPKAKYQGLVVLSVMVTPEGKAAGTRRRSRK
jgi:hypothetical protein